MIKCFITLCLLANPTFCQAPIEITPIDHVITSPMECGRGGFIYFTQGRMAQQTPEQSSPKPVWFPKVSSRLEGDGSDIVRKWVEEERARAARLEPQIK
jgi:hypothetical protein